MVQVSAIAMIVFFVGLIIWLVIFAIVLKNTFSKQKQKVIWIIVLVVFPPSALLFPFIGMKQIK